MKYKHFSVEERERIQELLWQKASIRVIARALGRSPSSVSREVHRNEPPERHRYTPRLAHERALRNRRRRGREERLKDEALRAYVVSRLKLGWSPEQVAATAEKAVGVPISHEAIYQYVYAQIYQGGHGYVKPGREDLRPCLKRRHKRRAKKGMRTGRRVFRPQGPSIEDRPVIVERRSRAGDWEGDTIESRNHAPGLNSLVERKSGLVFLTKVEDGTAAATRTVVVRRLLPLPPDLRRTLTVDNGPENQEWQETEREAGMRCFFAHPYHSWERGTNENTNGLVRWYFPKGTDFRTIPDEEIARVEHLLNTRPRKRLGWRTPLEVMGVALHG